MNSFVEAFLLVFVAEMGDKSQLLSLAFATKYKLSTVIMGIAIGIGLNHGLAIIAGSFVSQYIELDYIRLIASGVFIIFGLLSLRLEYEDEEEESNYFKNFGPVLTVAGTFFIGELGDKTQILAMTMGAIADNKLMIFISTFSSMMVVSIIGIFVGRILKKQVPEVTMNLIAAVLFLFFGLSGIWDGFEVFNINKLFILPVLITVVLFVFLIYQQNQRKKEEYFIKEISNNLENCVGCTKESCHCETKANIERLTTEYLGGDVVFIGNIINYIEDLKNISPKKYYKLYQKILEEGFDEDVMMRHRKG